jgi:hypothetical protein
MSDIDVPPIETPTGEPAMRYSHSFRPRTTGGAFTPNRFRKETPVETETRLRREYRELVAGELKYTTKGKRGEAYNAEPQVEPATIAHTILHARRAPLTAAAQARAARRAA